jgi:hypothetical protein
VRVGVELVVRVGVLVGVATTVRVGVLVAVVTTVCVGVLVEVAVVLAGEPTVTSFDTARTVKVWLAKSLASYRPDEVGRTSVSEPEALAATVVLLPPV